MLELDLCAFVHSFPFIPLLNSLITVNFNVLFNKFIITDGEPIKLPDNLESLPRADYFPTQRHRWNTNEVRSFFFIAFVLMFFKQFKVF